MLTKVSGPVGLSDAGNNLSPNGVGGLDNGHHFSVGDLVQICSDMERMKVSDQIILMGSFLFPQLYHLYCYSQKPLTWNDIFSNNV